jgi:hypothetical protein
VDVWLRGKRVRLDPRRSLGKGGEAEVFDAGAGRAVKVFKGPDHADYQGQPHEQQAARERIEEHQRKLQQFPRPLPPQVIVPEELALDAQGRVLGYEMRLLDDAEPLSRWGEPRFRRAGATQARAASVLRGLHGALSALHGAGVVVGDLNDLNLLVRRDEAHFIDADSFQFGPFACRVFTERFVDPLLCAKDAPQLVRPHGQGSDWYAFAALVCQTLLCVGPHGGIHRPKDPARLCPPRLRALRRLTVFDPEVQYPKPATPWQVLPDDLLHELREVLERDARRPLARPLLEALEFRTCARCGAEHARASCPLCSPHAQARAATVAVRGQVRCTRVARTRGAFVVTAVQQGELRWLAHEEGRLLREDGSCPLRGPLDPQVRFALQGASTLLACGSELWVLRPGHAPERRSVDQCGAQPSFAAAAHTVVWASEGRLLRDSPLGPAPIGEVLQDRTRLWCGDSLGLGLYAAGALAVAFLFDPERRGVIDSLPLPALRGQLVGAHGLLSEARAWLRVTCSESGRLVHRARCYDRAGALLASAEAREGDPDWPWLDALEGGCAASDHLFVPGDAGVVRVEAAAGALCVAQRFPDTEPFVDAASRLLPGPGGLYVVDKQEISLLQIR